MVKRNTNKTPKNIFDFYSETDAMFDRSVSREFSFTDAKNSITLYRIDIVKSKSKNFYGESKPSEKKILDPVELNIVLDIGDIDNEYRAEIGIHEQRINKFSFGVYIDDLEEKNVTINRGDYFIYNDGDKKRVYEITIVSNIDTKNSLMGDKPMYKLVEATQVKEDVFSQFKK